MQILKYKKSKDNTYDIEFDNNIKINLYDDTIIRFNLLTKKNITTSEFNEITKYNDESTSYYKSVKYINIKLRSEKEIKAFLNKKNYTNDIIENTIKRLKKEGYLNSKLYIESYINDQINLSNNGYNKILNNLIALGFNESDIKEKLDSFNKEIWNNKLNKIIDKKIKTNYSNSVNKLKDKIVYDLINLGYLKEDIIEVLNIKQIDDNEIFVKDYKKIKEKLSKKYEGYELNYQLKNKLYQKGYNLDLINKYLNDIND